MVVFMEYDSDKYYKYIRLSNKNIKKIPKDWQPKCKILNLSSMATNSILVPPKSMPKCIFITLL